MSYEFYNPTRVLFGAGQLNHLHEQKMPGKKAMVVISNGKSTRASGALDRTMKELSLAGVEVVLFDKVGANPVKEIVEEGGHFAKKEGCDFIVALGGGSVMDAAKVMAMYAQQPGDLWDYVAGATGKQQPLVNPVLPVIAITTTAGTGSEVDQWGVVTNPATNEKIGCGGMDELFPVIAVVDPELMLTVPSKFTAYQGFDALFHSVEGYLSVVNSLMSEMVQLAAIENIGTYLPRAVKDGSDLEAREHVAFANTMSGYSMVVGSCTSEHSMEHAMSAFHPALPHGAGLIMISKAYFSYFVRNHGCDDRFIELARLLGMTEATKPEDFITALVRLQEACGVADLKMSDYGITPDEFGTYMRNTREVMGIMFTGDRVQMSDEDIVQIFAESYK